MQNNVYKYFEVVLLIYSCSGCDTIMTMKNSVKEIHVCRTSLASSQLHVRRYFLFLRQSHAILELDVKVGNLVHQKRGNIYYNPLTNKRTFVAVINFIKL